MYSSQTHAIICYIESHVQMEKLDYRELEQKIGLSLVHIRDLFQRNTGCSLGRYVRTRKIWNSAFELAHSRRSVMDIALQYGFSSHESYTRAFKRIVGMSPREFRKEGTITGKRELMKGVYGVGLLDGKNGGAMEMNREKYKDNEGTILYGVPKVGYGEYGGGTPYPICLKACSDYLGEYVSYAYLMAATGAAFRLTWNEKDWDLGNVDIYHTFEENGEAYALGARALGREFTMLGRKKDTKKEEFIEFIRSHIDAGYPCIALGIIGPPEACLITGYRENGNVLLGWNFFQEDPDFAKNVEIDDCGYFICSDWWENTDTHAVMCIGAPCGEKISEEEILQNAVRVLSGRKEGSYCKGILAYDAWAEMLGDNRHFTGKDIFSALFHKMLCQNDATVCLADGRSRAAEYFLMLAKEASPEQKKAYEEMAELFRKVGELASRQQELLGSWEDMEKLLSNLADEKLRKELCGCIYKMKELDEEALRML